jgi:hypothetical protein
MCASGNLTPTSALIDVIERGQGGMRRPPLTPRAARPGALRSTERFSGESAITPQCKALGEATSAIIKT